MSLSREHPKGRSALKACPTCGGPLVLRSFRIVMVEQAVNPKTGRIGRPRKAADQDDGAPHRLYCPACKDEFFTYGGGPRR
jgi:competence CoiA-like predicted nuclease